MSTRSKVEALAKTLGFARCAVIRADATLGKGSPLTSPMRGQLVEAVEWEARARLQYDQAFAEWQAAGFPEEQLEAAE